MRADRNRSLKQGGLPPNPTLLFPSISSYVGTDGTRTVCTGSQCLPNQALLYTGRDILQPIASGAIREADVLGDLYDLVGGSVDGRRSDSDITFFKNAGGGHLDLMTAELIFQRLVDQNRPANWLGEL